MSLSDRFWAKVAIIPEHPCWEWVGAQWDGGYGHMGRDGRNIGAHRISWELKHGPIPAGLHVLHRCDNPSCVNPDHLWLGTHRDNIIDMHAKKRGGRHRGRSNGRSLAPLVHEALDNGEAQKSIAQRLGLGTSTVSRIATGKRHPNS